MKKTVILRAHDCQEFQKPLPRKAIGASKKTRMLISLFCGPGGFDAGFRQAGFKSMLAIDTELAACRTFERNYPETSVYQADLSTIKRGYITDRLLEVGNKTDPIGVIGGPPCQAFSQSNGHKSPEDPRAQLPKHYAAILKELNGKFGLDFFVFENVLGIMQKQHQEVLDNFRRLFRGAGFNIFEGELNAADFGVPQIRKRLFIVGLNRDKFADTVTVNVLARGAPVIALR